MKAKMAIVGDSTGVLAFTAVGVEAFSVKDENEGKELIKRLAKDYKIIFLTEELAVKLPDVIEKYLTAPYPIILAVPGKDGSNGYGEQMLKSAMDKALGVDVLFNKKGD